MLTSTSDKIRYFIYFVLTGVGIAVIYHLILSFVFDLGFPWNTFLFKPHIRFSDLTDSITAVSSLNPYYTKTNGVNAYFPFTYILLSIFNNVSSGTAVFAFIIISVFLMMAALFTYQHTVLKSNTYPITLLWALLLSYPSLFSLDRANLDSWIAPLEAIFVLLLNTRSRWLGAVFLATAIAFKGYPAALLLLAIAERHFFLAIFTAGLALILNIISLYLFVGNFSDNLLGFCIGLRDYKNLYIIGTWSANYSADFYNAIRSLATISAPKVFLHWYNIATLIFAGIASFYILFVRPSRWQSVMTACLIILIFPNVSNDYKLLSLLPGALLLLSAAANGEREKLALFCLCLLMVPKQYVYFNGLTISVYLTPVIILVLTLTTIYDKKAWMRLLQKLSRRSIP